MNWQDNLQLWKDDPNLDPSIRLELEGIKDKRDLQDRFESFASFGTGGIRAKLGVGVARLNYYTIARATTGLANYILKNGGESSGVVISYDTRHFSHEFAVISANILTSKGIKVYLCDHVTPTPELSFLVRHFKANQGIMITASHNPAIYNGYKVYDADGGQITLETAKDISKKINECKNYLELPITRELTPSKLLMNLDGSIEELYLKQLKRVVRNSEMIKKYGSELKIVYTPLHGTGKKLVTEGLSRAGFTNLQVVTQQAIPDPDFSTVEYPNPEFPSAFNLSMELGQKNKADILIATDPDADRLGVALRDHNGEYKLLTGNQMGALMIDYLCRNLHKYDNKKYQVIKTIVTSDFGAKIAKYYHCDVRETLTGFKFIGEQVEMIEKAQDSTKYLFGYEESYGYLIEPYVRDKDSIQAALLTAEIALNLKLNGVNLLDRLNYLYEQFGYYQEKLITKTFSDKEDSDRLIGQIANLRQNHPKSIGNLKVSRIQDFDNSEEFVLDTNKVNKLSLPKSNVMKIILNNDSWLAIRPSGTEPKIKLYISSIGKNKEEADRNMFTIEKFANNLVN